MQIWLRRSPNVSAMLASMNSAGLPTTVGSLLVEPATRGKTSFPCCSRRVLSCISLDAGLPQNVRSSHQEICEYPCALVHLDTQRLPGADAEAAEGCTPYYDRVMPEAYRAIRCLSLL